MSPTFGFNACTLDTICSMAIAGRASSYKLMSAYAEE